jgi:Cof subfamily protein (haloacid dehalogenase superfamily)
MTAPTHPAAPIKLVIVDIDGTIAGRSNQVSTRVKEAIKAAQAQGVRVGVATGRMYRSAVRFHQEIGADVPVMAYQGAWIQDPVTNQEYRHLRLDRSIARELIDYFQQSHLPPDLSLHVYVNDQLYVQKVNSDTDEYMERSGVGAIALPDLRDSLTAAPTKVLAMHPDEDLIDRLLRDLKTKYQPDQLHITTSIPIFLETTNPAVNKSTAIDYVARELLNIDASQIMTIGDNYNDVEMLAYAGWGVAMGNAPQPVQDYADWVAPSVDEDGVAVAIEKFILA